MSGPEALLVFGTNEQSLLVESLFQLGFLPLMRSKMINALKMIRRRRFAAVLVDRDHLESDILEFVLNVRDLDSEIPIVVVGQAADANEDRAVAIQENTFMLNNASPSKLKHRLTQILNAA